MPPGMAAVAAEFWARVGVEEPFPRSLEASILWALPLAIVKIPRLRLSLIEAWLTHRSIPSVWPRIDREVRACLVAARGHGVVFLDGSDPASELRISLAHETAHFMLDHLAPRQTAIAAFGDEILAVLDGDRLPTIDERLSAALRGVSIRACTHILDRSPDGDPLCGKAFTVEDRADCLALELLAPRTSVSAAVRSALGTSLTGAPTSEVRSLLISHFGLPPEVAASYLASLVRATRPARPIREWLGIAAQPNLVEVRRGRGNEDPSNEDIP